MIVCPRCEGVGKRYAIPTEACPQCGGKGFVEDPQLAQLVRVLEEVVQVLREIETDFWRKPP